MLKLAHQHIADRAAQRERNLSLIEPLDVDEYCVSILDGCAIAVRFNGEAHSDFKKADRKGWSFPKKGTEWKKRFDENPGHDARCYDLARSLGVPTTLQYRNDTSNGMSSIARGFNSGVGFLWLSEAGPFALYVPDVAAKVARYEADGYIVDEACKNFKPEFDGARPILKEEWELTVAQHRLAEAKTEVAS